jgi:transcription initiation factor IIE alpha subunit
MEMPKCPECGEEIHELFYTLIDGGRAWLNDDGELEYELASDTYGDSVIGIRFTCPECGAELFDNEEDAEDFLKPKAKQTILQ